MSSAEESIDCRGVNGSISLSKDKMVSRSEGFGSVQFREMPLNKITAVVVERKSVIPFATLTILATAVTVSAWYNALWFLINLTELDILTITSGGLIVAVVCAVPMMFRLLFVNVLVRSEGEPDALMVRLVPVHQAKRLARRFRELSSSW
ncbi:MAG TPA: hypothetical protein VEG61_02325 [Candidatus Dormibacteraeota bacterium]|nr:hypothetical protein [Candidatus Dormibacteraeota bacterium]